MPHGKGIGGHQLPNRGMTNDWITPPALLGALGDFDLDPCACSPQPWRTARVMIAPPYDGLTAPWHGRVWLNPPYGAEPGKWLQKLARHGLGVALTFARTETRFFHDWVLCQARWLFLFRGRLTFHRPDGTKAPYNAGGPHCLAFYGEGEALERFPGRGRLGTFGGHWIFLGNS